MKDLGLDFRYALRMLRKNPGFTAVAVLTLALGVGASTAIFSVLDAVVLHSAPYQNPSQLVEIGERSPQGKQESVSAGDFTAWQGQLAAFQDIAAYQLWKFQTLTGLGEPDEVWASPVSENLFRLLRVNTFLGRTFAANETPAVILSHEYWRSHFSSDRSIIGKTLALDSKPYLVIGIAPADFEFPGPNAQMWIPLTFSAAEKNDHEKHVVRVIARLKPGSTLQQAQAEIDTISHRLAMQYPQTNTGWSAHVDLFTSPGIPGTLRTAVIALLGAVVFVLMIVCANVASMLLARGATRRGEMAIRAALGAGRSRLVRQLLVESLLLASLASVAGLLVAFLALDWTVSFVPKYSLIQNQGLHRIAINRPVLAFTAALTLLTGIAVGLLPAMRISGRNLDQWLKQRGRTLGTSTQGSGLQRALIVTEVALALVLLVGAGLMIQSFQHLGRAPTGFNPDHVLTVRVPLVNYKYAQGPQSANFYREVLQRIAALPGVKSAAMANNLPFTGFHTTVIIPLPGGSRGLPRDSVGVTQRSISPGYFETMQMPLKAGRDFTPADSESNASCVRIINEAMAHRYWPGADAVGKQLFGSCPKNATALIVGVVRDSKQNSVQAEAEPELYEPYAQHPFASFLVTFVIRTSQNPLELATAVRNAVWEVDHDQPVIQIRTMENVIAESIWQQHFSASMMGIFAAIALLLSAIGIYGVLSYSISQRTHEIGIRAALGASPRDILRLVVGEGLFLIALGVAAGIVAALGLTRLLTSLLYGVRPRDPLTFVALTILLAIVALLGVYIPARRATKVDPMVALRYE